MKVFGKLLKYITRGNERVESRERSCEEIEESPGMSFRMRRSSKYIKEKETLGVKG